MNPGLESRIWVGRRFRTILHSSRRARRDSNGNPVREGNRRNHSGGPDAPLTVGWVQITADGPILSTAFYSVEIDGAALPPVAVLPVKGSQGWSGASDVSDLVNTGFPLANIGPDAADCTLQAYTEINGRSVGSTTIQLPPRIQTARFLSQMMPGLPNPYQGSFSLNCEGGRVVPVALTQRTVDNAIVAVSMSPIP